MKRFAPKTSLVCGFSLWLFISAFARSADLLAPEQPLVIEGTHGKFDFLAIDADGRRLLAAHPGNASFDVIDLDQHKVVKVIPTGVAQASAVDVQGQRYLVAVSKPPQLVTVDPAKLEVSVKIPLTGPADLIAFQPKSGKAYIGHDDGRELWVYDSATQGISGTVNLTSEGPEDLGFDTSLARLFQGMKAGSVVDVIDLATDKVLSSWPTAPAQAPHGMAMLPEMDAFLVAGGNGKLVMMSQKDGHVIASTDIPAKVDQLAYDHEWHRLYCASGTGKIAIVDVEKEKLSSLGEARSSEGCHSIAVDPKTHTVWVAYAKGETSVAQSFTARQ